MPDVKQLSGTQFQGWQLGRVLGWGADGVVYAGTQNGVERAIKIFLPESLDKNGRAEAKQRLEVQLSLVGRESHPNLVNVYGGGEDAALATLFLVMDLVPGLSLDKVLDKVPPDAIPTLLGQLASAAEFLERQDLYHRDIKPANVVISPNFTKLTLLDLGVVYHANVADENGRLSGHEFVATLRYSPPEFVWRTEQTEEQGAWRAVTFYQIGATVHDMIMRKPLFHGMDQPRANLYDCVRDHTPKIESDAVPGWLIQVAQACLLKDWRQRLQMVRDWTRFVRPAEGLDTDSQEFAIRVRQARREEVRQAEARRATPTPAPNREQELWQLNSAVFMEVRTYLIDSSIFPRFRTAEEVISDREYQTTYVFEKDVTRAFPGELVVRLELKVAPLVDAATQMTFESSAGGALLVTASWTEMFTVETAFSLCKKALLDSVEVLIPRE